MSRHTRPPAGRPPKNPQTPGTSPRQVRPPFDGQRMPLPGVSDTTSLRRTAQTRPLVAPTLIAAGDGYGLVDPYIRRYWVAAIGPGAVADLLRLAAAAQSGRSLRMPVHMPVLIREGLVIRTPSDGFGVLERIPPVPRPLVERLPSRLRGELSTTRRHRSSVP